MLIGRILPGLYDPYLDIGMMGKVPMEGGVDKVEEGEEKSKLNHC